MIASSLFLLSAFSALGVRAQTLWSGNFNYYTSVSVFDQWSWSNETGEYQWYIHGNETTPNYLALSSSYKNPADTSETQGLKLTINPTSTWNSAFLRSELIPQTTNNLGVGQMYYHFSISCTNVNTPNASVEHQIVFFESHFTELKLGVGSTPTDLVWMVTGVQQWATTFTPGTWYNFAYDINFTAGTVGLWASTGSSPLVKVIQNVAASTSTNSEDWHLGVLRLAGGVTEDWYFSGVYIEENTITTKIGTGSGVTTTTGSSSTSVGSSSSATTTTPTTSTSTTTSSSSTATQTEYGQCGGIGWTGPTVCASGCTCKAVSPPYYSQCLT
jgi:hypothetical protein